VAKLLLVENDDAIVEPLVRALSREGHDVVAVTNGLDALASMDRSPPDLVLLDLGLPDLDGVEVCRRIRMNHPRVPVIMLTARTEELDIVIGLDAGANDYIPKPFRQTELLARVRSQLRFVAPAAEIAVYEVQDLVLDLGARQVRQGGELVDLSVKEFDLLALLMREAGAVVTRDKIMNEVWDSQGHGSTKTLDMHVSWLRRKLGDDPTSPRYIATVRGIGLRFELS
jgi:DNA-binding response OmpR family regulator